MNSRSTRNVNAADSIDYVFMCQHCKTHDQLSIYDKKCFSCYEINPFHEPYSKAYGKYQWVCQNEDCSSLNCLPSVECRNCYVSNEVMKEVLKNCKTFSREVKSTAKTYWICKNFRCHAINDSSENAKCCHKCYQVKDLYLKSSKIKLGAIKETPSTTTAKEAKPIKKNGQRCRYIKFCLQCSLPIEKLLYDPANPEADSAKEAFDSIFVCKACFGIDLEERKEELPALCS